MTTMLRAYTSKDAALDIDALYLERQQRLQSNKARVQARQVQACRIARQNFCV